MNARSFWCNSPLSPDKHHSTRGWYESRFVDAVPLFLIHHHRADIRAQILVGRAFPEQPAQIMVFLAEKTGAELTIGSQPNARAMSAERLRDRSDQRDFARRAIRKPILPSSFAAFVRNLLQRPARMDTPMNLRRGNHHLAAPMAIRVQWHKLNKAHDDAAFPCKRCESFHLIII